MRFLYCACAISSMLNDWGGVDKDSAERYIRSCTTYEGGIALVPGMNACVRSPYCRTRLWSYIIYVCYIPLGNEAHAGSTYCAVAALSLMGRLPAFNSSSATDDGGGGNSKVDDLVKWCLFR